MAQMAKIKEIEDEMARTQRNKATEGHLGMLKAKLAKLKREMVDAATKGGGGGGGDGFEVSKVGDARVGFVGFPSVGKSTLLTKLTGTFSESADYEFTTLTAVPGILRYRGARIQLLDLPGIIEGANDGKGRGRQVIAAAQTCDLILICLDALKPLTHKKIIERELEGFGIRLNKTLPNITFRKKDRGGVSLVNNDKASKLDLDAVKGVLAEYRIHNADVIVKGPYDIDDLIDVIEGARAYIPAIYVINKIDQITLEELYIMDRISNYCPISSYHEWNLDTLVQMIWERLDMVRVYTKPKGRLPDYNDPVVMKRGKCTVEHFCNKIHKMMIKSFKHAHVWGSSVKHRPQKVGKEHVLEDEDIVQIVKKV
ncbi:unnamed protein product [Pedinophyceae sp. YPF-701]|nr:unnamed protein product [Pedinophyceae sp. YPF-701]